MLVCIFTQIFAFVIQGGAMETSTTTAATSPLGPLPVPGRATRRDRATREALARRRAVIEATLRYMGELEAAGAAFELMPAGVAVVIAARDLEDVRGQATHREAALLEPRPEPRPRPRPRPRPAPGTGTDLPATAPEPDMATAKAAPARRRASYDAPMIGRQYGALRLDPSTAPPPPARLRVEDRLARLCRSGWAVEDDLALVEGLLRGRGVGEVARALERSEGQTRDRWRGFRAETLDEQRELLAALRDRFEAAQGEA